MTIFSLFVLIPFFCQFFSFYNKSRCLLWNCQRMRNMRGYNEKDINEHFSKEMIYPSLPSLFVWIHFIVRNTLQLSFKRMKSWVFSYDIFFLKTDVSVASLFISWCLIYNCWLTGAGYFWNQISVMRHWKSILWWTILRSSLSLQRGNIYLSFHS